MINDHWNLLFELQNYNRALDTFIGGYNVKSTLISHFKAIL